MLDKPFKLKLDKTPTLVYIQHEKYGIGELHINGKRIFGLQKIEIKAATKTHCSFPELKLKIGPEKLAEFGTLEE